MQLIEGTVCQILDMHTEDSMLCIYYRVCKPMPTICPGINFYFFASSL